jgi:hypothetical protein
VSETPTYEAIYLARAAVAEVSDESPIATIAVALTRPPWDMSYADACELIGRALRLYSQPTKGEAGSND